MYGQFLIFMILSFSLVKASFPLAFIEYRINDNFKSPCSVVGKLSPRNSLISPLMKKNFSLLSDKIDSMNMIYQSPSMKRIMNAFSAIDRNWIKIVSIVDEEQEKLSKEESVELRNLFGSFFQKSLQDDDFRMSSIDKKALGEAGHIIDRCNSPLYKNIEKLARECMLLNQEYAAGIVDSTVSLKELAQLRKKIIKISLALPRMNGAYRD